MVTWLFIIPLVPEFCFPLFLRYNLRVAPIIYRLIGATLIGKFFDDPFFFLKSIFLPYLLNIAGQSLMGYTWYGDIGLIFMINF